MVNSAVYEVAGLLCQPSIGSRAAAKYGHRASGALLMQMMAAQNVSRLSKSFYRRDFDRKNMYPCGGK